MSVYVVLSRVPLHNNHREDEMKGSKAWRRGVFTAARLESEAAAVSGCNSSCLCGCVWRAGVLSETWTCFRLCYSTVTPQSLTSSQINCLQFWGVLEKAPKLQLQHLQMLSEMQQNNETFRVMPEVSRTELFLATFH